MDTLLGPLNVHNREPDCLVRRTLVVFYIYVVISMYILAIVNTNYHYLNSIVVFVCLFVCLSGLY